MDDNRQGKPRWNKRCEVMLQYGQERVKGFLSNISNEGMEIRCKTRLQMSDEITVRVLTPDGNRYNYLSEVRWWRPAVGSKMGKGIFRHGLRFLAIDPSHDELLAYIKYDPARRKHPRIQHELPVEIKSAAEFVEAVTENISQDGAFLRIDDFPPPYRDDQITIDIALPQSQETILAKARVVHILQPSWAQKLGLPPGIGLHFMDLTDEARAKLKEFLEKNGHNGESDDTKGDSEDNR